MENEIYQVDMLSEEKDVSSVVQGHSDELWGLAMHPTMPVIITAGIDRTLRCWDAESRRPIEGKSLALPYQVHCLAISPDGQHLAIGFAHGAKGPPRVGVKYGPVPVRVVRYDDLEFELASLEVAQERVSCLQYSPASAALDGAPEFLAVGSEDQSVYLYAVVGHSYDVGRCSWA